MEVIQMTVFLLNVSMLSLIAVLTNTALDGFTLENNKYDTLSLDHLISRPFLNQQSEMRLENTGYLGLDTLCTSFLDMHTILTHQKELFPQCRRCLSPD